MQSASIASSATASSSERSRTTVDATVCRGSAASARCARTAWIVAAATRATPCASRPGSDSSANNRAMATRSAPISPASSASMSAGSAIAAGPRRLDPTADDLGSGDWPAGSATATRFPVSLVAARPRRCAGHRSSSRPTKRPQPVTAQRRRVEVCCLTSRTPENLSAGGSNRHSYPKVQGWCERPGLIPWLVDLSERRPCQRLHRGW